MNTAETVAGLITALDLPSGCQVGKRVPKKMLSENGAPKAVDRRAINDGIEELVWLAALKPTTIGVAAYRDDVREYLEIAVLQLILRTGAKSPRLVELTHRAVPYPVLLLTGRSDGVSVSAAHKRWSHGEIGKTVLDGDVVEAHIGAGLDDSVVNAFRDALALNRQPRLSLHALFQGWIDTLLAFRAARITGLFTLAGSPVEAIKQRDALAICERLGTEITRLRSLATKEKQIAKQIELNVQIKRLEKERASAIQVMSGGKR